MNLTHIHELFASNDSDDDDFMDGRPGPSTTDYSVYPQAGTRIAGHFQGEGIMTMLYPLVDGINKRIIQVRRATGEDDDEYINHPITAIASQGYNSVMHYTRGYSSQHHEVQTGKVTSCLAGAWATTAKNRATADCLKRECDATLPHQSYVSKINNPNITTDLRLENVFMIDVTTLPAEMESGE
jgi:hypothetical protein